MSMSRRRFLASALIFRLGRATARAIDDSKGLAGSGVPGPKASSTDFREMWIRETGGAAVSHSDAIALNIPAVAEDGAIVPVALGSRIAQTDRLVLFVERNPFPFIAAFDFAESAVPGVSLNIKMNESSAVIVLVRAANRFYRTERHVRVVRGGCGDSPGQLDTNR